MILDVPIERPDFSSAGISIPDIINLNIDESGLITCNDIEDAFLDALYNSNDTILLAMDLYYYKASYRDYERFLYLNTWAHKGEFMSSFNDCDDYSFKIYGMFCQDNWSGLPVGVIIWTNPKHADPFFIDEDMNIWIIKNYDDVIPLSKYQQPDYEAKIIIV